MLNNNSKDQRFNNHIEYILATKRFDEPFFHEISFNIFILIIYALGTSFY